MVKPKSHCPSCGSREFIDHLEFYAIQAIDPRNAEPDGRKMLTRLSMCAQCGLIFMFPVTDDNSLIRYIDDSGRVSEDGSE